MKTLERILSRLETLIAENRFEEVETDIVELKSVPSEGGSWKERQKTVNAFLNTRGGILILGIEDKTENGIRSYRFTGWRSNAEPKIKDLRTLFTDKAGTRIDVSEFLPEFRIVDFREGQLGVLFVDELPTEKKFCFLGDHAWKRVITGEERIKEADISRLEELKEELALARELQVVESASLAHLDLDRLNEFIAALNRQVRIETLKPTIEAALPFLVKRGFVRDEKVTTLGLLVCGQSPERWLNFRCQVHGYVNPPQGTEEAASRIAQDKKLLINNILPLMEASVAYVLQNIQVGIRVEAGGRSEPEYPEKILRETINNALAHRDYHLDRQVIITIQPGRFIEIRNPGAFRKSQLIEIQNAENPVRRIVPDPRPRNPKLAQVLSVFDKWEGRGVGMATLTDYCLRNQLDLPYYRFYSENELGVFLRRGQLLDDEMDYLFNSVSGWIEQRNSGPLTEPQKLVLSYLIKSERENARLRYTVMLTPENNHFDALRSLETAGLISRHPESPSLHPVYLPAQVLVRTDYRRELDGIYGEALNTLDDLSRRILQIVYRHCEYSKSKKASARATCFNMFYADGGRPENIREFEILYRKVKSLFNRLHTAGFLRKLGQKGPGVAYEVNREFLTNNLC